MAGTGTGKKGLSPKRVQEAVRVLKVLGHPLRLRIVEFLSEAGGEHPVKDIQDAVGKPQATVSQQLALLRDRGIVAARRDGAQVLYSLAESRVNKILNCMRECEG